MRGRLPSSRPASLLTTFGVGLINNDIMKLIEEPKAEFMLQQSLDLLHRESREWLSAISFWEVELRFFRKLLVRTALRRAVADGHGQAIESLQDRLALFRREACREFEGEVNAHERTLSALLTGDMNKDDMAYREKHQLLATRIVAFQGRFRTLKTEIFKLVEETV